MNSQMTILHLDYDVLKIILLLVVTSAGGAIDLARMMAVCKMFAMFSEKEDLLKMANFENFSSPELAEHWLHIRGLLIRCSEAGNAGAQHLLAKVILQGSSELQHEESNDNKRLPVHSHTDQASSSRYVDQDKLLPSFLSYFLPVQAKNSNSNGKRFTHFELVSLFLKRCSVTDIVSMLPHVEIYVHHVGYMNRRYTEIFFCIFRMIFPLQVIVDVGRQRRTRYSLRLLNNRQRTSTMRNARNVLRMLQTSRDRLSPQPKWEELKKECQFIEEELLSSGGCAKPLDADSKILHLGKRFFYYLAFGEPVDYVIDLPLDQDVSNLQAECIKYAENYIQAKDELASLFDEMFL